MAKILLVDDEQSIREVLVTFFEIMYEFEETKEAKNGQEAVGIITGGFIPDIIISDIKMPEMSGVELFRTLRDFESIGWLFMTGNCSEQERAFFAENNLPVIQKPFNLKDFKERVDKLLLEQ